MNNKNEYLYRRDFKKNTEWVYIYRFFFNLQRSGFSTAKYLGCECQS